MGDVVQLVRTPDSNSGNGEFKSPRSLVSLYIYVEYKRWKNILKKNKKTLDNKEKV